jgi:hypothetical protein
VKAGVVPWGAIVVGLGGIGDHPNWQDGAQQYKHFIIPEIITMSSKYYKNNLLDHLFSCFLF